MSPTTNVLTLLLKPVTRLLVGLVAIPLVRTVRQRVPVARHWDEELEKDVDQWFRGSLLLLLATKNTETWLVGWWDSLMVALAAGQGAGVEMLPELDLNKWYITAGRLMLAIGVVESMPDQALFSIIHPGPRFKYLRDRSLFANLREQWRTLLRGLVCQHLNRSSPMFAILTVFYGGTVGWVFYALAIAQYLIIGLVTSRDRALDVLSQFDRAIAERRQEILDEFEYPAAPAAEAVPLPRAVASPQPEAPPAAP